MWPRLKPGRFYFASGWLKIRIGDFIVFKNPVDPSQKLVKKVEAIESNGYLVNGTVSWSTSSKDFGLITQDLILGRIF